MSHYSNGPGNIPRLPENVIHHLIAMADVSHNARRRFAPGPTGFTEYAQTAQLEQLVHDACEELLARLPVAAPASEPIDADMLVLHLREAGFINERGAMWLLNGDNMPFTLDGLVQVANLACKAAPTLPEAPEPAQQSD